jgi:ribosomal-protein-alanine N-acetyltransferase
MASRRAPAADVALRPAADADLDEIVAIERLAFSDPWSRHSFEQLLGNPAVRFTVAERRFGHASGVAGYAVAWFVVEQAEIANLAVAPSARRHGVGARLLDDVIAHAADRECDALFLEVRDSNVAARALYVSRGFRQIGRRRNYYRNPIEDALVLRRDVAPRDTR